jgi:hypothetical protein
MAFSELEHRRYDKAVGKYVESRRPPRHIRSQLDLSHRIHRQSVEIFEVRPAFDDPGVKTESPVAKATFVKKEGAWRIYWQRADLKWHRYEPRPSASTIEQFLEVVEEDELCCFFG